MKAYCKHNFDGQHNLEPVNERLIDQELFGWYKKQKSNALCFRIHPERDLRFVLGTVSRPYEDFVVTVEDYICCACMYHQKTPGRSCDAILRPNGKISEYCESRTVYQNHLHKQERTQS